MDKKEKAKKFFLVILRSAPILSGMVNSRLRDHQAAFKELLITLIFTTIPLWLGCWVGYISAQNPWAGFYDAIFLSIINGDIFLFSTSILAPVVYIALCEPQGSKEFPSKTSHSIFVILILVMSSVAYGIQRAGLPLNKDSISNTSLIFFLISAFLLYIAMVFKNRSIPDRADDMKTDERQFSNAFKNHR